MGAGVSRVSTAGGGGGNGNGMFSGFSSFEDYANAYEKATGKKVSLHGKDIDYESYSDVAAWVYQKGGEKALVKLVESRFNKYGKNKDVSGIESDLKGSKYSYKVISSAIEQFTYGQGPDDKTWSSTEIRRVQRLINIDTSNGRQVLAKLHGNALEDFVESQGRVANRDLFRGFTNTDKNFKVKVGYEVDFRGVSSWTSDHEVAADFSEDGGNTLGGKKGHGNYIFVLERGNKIKSANVAKYSGVAEEREYLISKKAKFEVTNILNDPSDKFHHSDEPIYVWVKPV